MNNVTTVGIRLAKNVFSVHGVDAVGPERLRGTVRRGQLLPLIAQWAACLMGMEACSGAHECPSSVSPTNPWRCILPSPYFGAFGVSLVAPTQPAHNTQPT